MGIVAVLDQIFIPFDTSSFGFLGAKFIIIWDIVIRNKRKQQRKENLSFLRKKM